MAKLTRAQLEAENERLRTANKEAWSLLRDGLDLYENGLRFKVRQALTALRGG